MPASPRAAPPGAGDVDVGLDELGEVVGIGPPPGGRSSFSYHRLPEPLLRLAIRKLDGSSFDVQIGRAAAVWELKAAVEDVFTVRCDDEGKTISWRDVWGHFCLCYKHLKLTDEKATLRSFGIRDGDELHFVRHLSVDYSPLRRHAKNHEAASHRRSMTSVEYLAEDDEGKLNCSEIKRSNSVVDEEIHGYDCSEEQSEQQGSKKGGFFRGLFSYSRLRSSRKTHSEDIVPCSKPRKEQKSTPSKLVKWLSSKKSTV